MNDQQVIKELTRRNHQLEAQLKHAKTIAALLAEHVKFEVVVPDNDPDDVFGYQARCPLCGVMSPGMSQHKKHTDTCPKVIALRWGNREGRQQE